MKKLAALAGSAALLFSMAGSAFAFFGPDVEYNWASVYNKVYSKANSGGNEIGGMFVKGGTIVTGSTASSPMVVNTVNSLEGCGCGLFSDVQHNMALLTNKVYSKANSGYNEVHGMFVGGGTIVTGSAGSYPVVSNVVNSIVTPIAP